MLRRAVFGLGCCLILAGIAVLAVAHTAAGVALIVNGALITLGLLIERHRYKPELDTPPGPGWEATGERMVDAEGTTAVWFNPATGERVYVKSGRS
jgi:hypothetical protein